MTGKAREDTTVKSAQRRRAKPATIGGSKRSANARNQVQAALGAALPPGTTDQDISLGDIGARLRAFRMGRGLTSDELADRLGLSRAALYRAEGGQIAKIETLTRISEVLNVSLASLLGVGVEYIDNSIAFFERMRQLEEVSDEIIGLFGPVSYLLTSDGYDDMLSAALSDTLPKEPRERAAAKERFSDLFDILRQRKAHYQRRRPLIVSLITSADLERFLQHGMVTRADPDEDSASVRRRQAVREVRHIETLLRQQPIGVQIGLIQSPIPGTTFQLFRQKGNSALGISPFRLGEQLNVSMGVGLITRAAEPLSLHEEMAAKLWKDALKGERAADKIRDILKAHGDV